MPHTSRKTHQPNHQPSSSSNIPKRLQITSDDGWTHITTTNKSNNARRQRHILHKTTSHATTSSTPSDATAHHEQDREQYLVPADPPRDLTLQKLRAQFDTYQSRYEGSETGQVVRETIQKYISSSSAVRNMNIICVGLGSPSGFLRGGWVDRRAVSMYQLAALRGIMDVLGDSVKVYAQDPVFNTLDSALLSALDITVLQHPEAFTLVSPSTLLFCPGAERTHLEQLLSSSQPPPAALFGGPLEDSESEVIRGFLSGGRITSRRVPVFGEWESAFWGVRVYYPDPGFES